MEKTAVSDIPITDLTVTTANPMLLDETLRQLPGCVVTVDRTSFDGTTCIVRVYSGLDFLKFALKTQGYGEVIKEETL
jgi:hypothetical protein